MRALITGGAGFIGSNIADALLARGVDVRILDSLLKPVHNSGWPAYLSPELERMEGDCTNAEALCAALKDVDVVFHQAAYQGVLPDFSKFFRVNTVGTSLLFEVIVQERLPIQKVIVASSQAVYGDGKYACAEHGVHYPGPRSLQQLQQRQWDPLCSQCGSAMSWMPLDEPVIAPTTSYAISKSTQETISLGLGRRHDIPVTCLRYSIVQGPRQSLTNLYSGVLRIFYSRIRQSKPATAYEDGRMLRDYVHVQDVVAANLLALDDRRTDFECYNVGSGNPTSVMDYAHQLMKALNHEVPIHTGTEFRFGDARHLVSDVGKLRTLGWNPSRSLDDILSDFLPWAESASFQVNSLAAEDELRQKQVVLKTK